MVFEAWQRCGLVTALLYNGPIANSNRGYMYYRIALISPFSFSPDDPAWNTYEELRCAGHAVEVIDPQRFPSVLGPDGDVNESAFELFRASFKPHCVVLGNKSIDDILAACHAACENGLPAMERPAKRFLVFGYLGKDNFGDEFVFSLILRNIQKRWPEAVVTAIGQNPQATFARHGVTSIEPDMKFEMDVLMNGASALVFMAGLVFDTPCFDWTAGKTELFLNPYSEIPGQVSCVQLAWMHGVPTIYLGIGAGPLANPDAQALMRLAGLCRPLFAARDAETAALLAKAGIDPSLIKQTADVSLMLAQEREAYVHPAKSPRIVVALRDFPSVDEDFPRRVAFALDECFERHGASPLFLDFEPDDRTLHQRTADAMRHGKEAVFAVARTDREALALIGSARTVLATRLHGSIIANAFGIPSVGFDYNEKVRSHYKLMGQERLLCPLDASADCVVKALGLAFDQHDSLSQRLQCRTDRLAQQSFLNFELLADMAEGHEARPKPQRLYDKRLTREAYELAACRAELETARALCQEAQAAAKTLRKENAELRGSTAWKVGRALTALPRAIKDARKQQPR